MRKIIFMVFAAALLASCGNKGKKESSAGDNVPEGIVNVEFASLIENPQNFIGKTISVEGKVVHVCRHSGKKLFITGEDPDIRLFISAGEDMPKFPVELNGNEIVVEGTLTMAQAEGLAEGEKHHAAEGDSCETEKALAKQPVLSELMMVYNKHSLVK